jgi:hypothetical protein
VGWIAACYFLFDRVTPIDIPLSSFDFKGSDAAVILVALLGMPDSCRSPSDSYLRHWVRLSPS